ncbi:MAG: PilT/PilU family type 4a pilus ATPase [Gammaproteobacteria bacterium]
MELIDYLQLIVKSEASDLFITVGSPPALKINGNLTLHGNEPIKPEDALALANAIMSTDQQKLFAQHLELNLAISKPGLGRFRVNLFHQRNQIAIVFRYIRSEIPSLDDLHLPPILKQLSLVKRGLILVVGATSTGKTTTLASMIEYRNQQQAGHIITIEDPIEFTFTHKKSIINQREVGVDTLSYGDALKNTLRQAPDAILIGEIRTREIMNYALTFSETGHLCLSTLHAANANQALERIISFFPRETHDQLLLELSTNLAAIICQRLIPTVDHKRAAAVEILIATPLVRDFIRRNEIDKLKGVMESSEDVGMQTLDSSLFQLYQAGRITAEEALRYADSSNNLRLKMNTKGINPPISNANLELKNKDE